MSTAALPALLLCAGLAAAQDCAPASSREGA